MQPEVEDGKLCVFGFFLKKHRMDSQRAGVLLREVGQVDVSKVDEQHPDGLFGGVQEPAGWTAGSLKFSVTLRRS